MYLSTTVHLFLSFARLLNQLMRKWNINEKNKKDTFCNVKYIERSIRSNLLNLWQAIFFLSNKFFNWLNFFIASTEILFSQLKSLFAHVQARF